MLPWNQGDKGVLNHFCKFTNSNILPLVNGEHVRNQVKQVVLTATRNHHLFHIQVGFELL
jgi:hypothetical protein